MFGVYLSLPRAWPAPVRRAFIFVVPGAREDGRLAEIKRSCNFRFMDKFAMKRGSATLAADINISLLKGKGGIVMARGKKDPDGRPGLGEEEALLFFG
jgi:hypothetical protein